jgi:hypothetical protein
MDLGVLCFRAHPKFVCWYFQPLHYSLLPQHKITNGIGLSAEEHVSWYLKDDKNNREGQVNGINAALGPQVREMVSTFL